MDIGPILARSLVWTEAYLKMEPKNSERATG
jgi:hypothetical protein